MTVNSYNGVITTNGEWATITSLTSFTFTQGTIYTIQAVLPIYIKIGDAIYSVPDGKTFQYKAGSDDIYIKVNYGSTPLSILEGEASVS